MAFSKVQSAKFTCQGNLMFNPTVMIGLPRRRTEGREDVCIIEPEHKNKKGRQPTGQSGLILSAGL